MQRTLLAAAIGSLAFVSVAPAATLYQQTFESPVTVGSAGPTNLGGFGQPSNNVQGSGFQLQGGGGGGGPSDTYGVDTNGVGNSQALVIASDNTAATSFTFQQITAYGSVGAPGAGTTTAQVQVSLALYVTGSETSTTPIGIDIQQGTNDFVFTPVIVNNPLATGGVFTPVTFTLDLATASAGAYDPTQSSNFRIQYGAGGFGFDNNNLVRIDNILIQTVTPEPASALSLASLGGLALIRRRRA